MLLLPLLGCQDPPVALTVPPPTPSVDAGERFVGSWLLDQPFHGAYEANVYTFGADGSLTVSDSFGLPVCDVENVQNLVPCSTGSVSVCPNPEDIWGCLPERRCVFGDRWTAIDEVTLIVSGICADGEERDIELLIPESDEPVAPIVLSVDGETGWDHDWWEWMFTRCDDDQGAGCLPF